MKYDEAWGPESHQILDHVQWWWPGYNRLLCNMYCDGNFMFFCSSFFTCTFFVSRVPFSIFFTGKNLFFHGCLFDKIFTGKNCFSRPLFCQFSEFFTGAFCFFTGKIAKYRVFFTGAFSFFTPKKKTDFFADFSQSFWEYPQNFFRFLSKILKISNFFDTKSEKNLDFFLENFEFFCQKNWRFRFFLTQNLKKIWIFFSKNSIFLTKNPEKILIFFSKFPNFLTKIWKNLGYSQLFWQKSAKKLGVDKNLQKNWGYSKWKKRRF